MTQPIAIRAFDMAQSDKKQSDQAAPGGEAPAETRVLTAHVPVALAEQVDQMAARLERSRGWVVKQALSDWVAQEEERRRFTLDALAEVEAGVLVDHQAVQAWADSLGTAEPLPAPSPAAPSVASKRQR
jgi:predicted transcriptional regulator